MNNPIASPDTAECVAESILETESPEITVFDVAQLHVQRYATRGGDGMLIIRVDDAGGTALVSLSLFGCNTTSGRREAPRIQLSTFDENKNVSKRCETYPLPSSGDGRVRYLIVGESEEAVRQSASDFRNGWGLAYNPLVGNPRLRRDGKWIAEATRWVSSD